MAEGDLRGTETILVVDDEELILTMGRMVLSSYGYTVLTANSGQKAIELFTRSKKKVDLVITDLVMPGMSGRELTDHILKVSPETRIVLVQRLFAFQQCARTGKIFAKTVHVPGPAAQGQAGSDPVKRRESA